MRRVLDVVMVLLALLSAVSPEALCAGVDSGGTEYAWSAARLSVDASEYMNTISDARESLTPRTGGLSALLAQALDRKEDRPGVGTREPGAGSRTFTETKPTTAGSRNVWKSEDLDMLGVGISVGDVDGDGKNEIVIIDPSTVYVYRFNGTGMTQAAEYSASPLELKSVDVAKLRKQGPCRIYVSAQNRGQVASFVLEYRNGALAPVVSDFDCFLRVINYPTHGPILLGQRKSQSKMYDGPIYRLLDKGDALEIEGRFGVPLKIPVFGFAIGDFEGNRKPLIVVYDKNDHLRIYTPDGKRIYLSKDFYGGSDVLLRWFGPEHRDRSNVFMNEEAELIFFRPRIMALDLDKDSVYEILAITHNSKTMRVLSRTKMLEDGQIKGLVWNGDSLEERWASPKISGLITDFAVDKLPGLQGLRLITLERKKTDWLSFLKSKSQVRAYDVDRLVRGSMNRSHKDSED